MSRIPCLCRFLAAWSVLLCNIAFCLADGLHPDQLRCEYLVNPIGIDVTHPRLSWALNSSTNGEKQTAYEIRVASDPAKLQAESDLWNSGKIESSATFGVSYGGKPLAAKQQCYWSVRVWDQNGDTSAWTAPASWSTGLLQPSDWGAGWIADPRTVVGKDGKGAKQPPHHGFQSEPATSADTPKQVTIDLGSVRPFTSVRLYPTDPFGMTPRKPGYGFPVRFQMEVGNEPDLKDATIIYARTTVDEPNPGARSVACSFAPTSARYVRLVATRLAKTSDKDFAMALAELRVMNNDTNVARGAAVTATDSIEKDGWSAKNLVDGRLGPDELLSHTPPCLLRKSFKLDQPVRRATLYATGTGLYEMRLNGKRVGTNVLSPEWTLYSARLFYNTFDVTNLLASGDNTLGALLGSGWYSGRVHWTGHPESRAFGGAQTGLIARLDIELQNGQTLAVTTDPTWKTTIDGPIRSADLYDGETYDQRQELSGWDASAFDDAQWLQAAPVTMPKANLVAQPNEPIRITQELTPVRLLEPSPGVYVFDLGQNFAGWCRLKVSGNEGDHITLRHAEWASDTGDLYNGNLPAANQADHFILRGGPVVLEPRFTYHGFRYVEITGMNTRPKLDDLRGCVLHSDLRAVGQFECSNSMVNQLMKNIDWTLRSNLMGVPTDCPQRSERLGWCGDIQAVSQTAMFQRDMAGFFTKWLLDLRQTQDTDGRFMDIAPPLGPVGANNGGGKAAWGDAGTIVPWRMYQNYGDTGLLATHYYAAKRWVDYLDRTYPYPLPEKQMEGVMSYGDWLAPEKMPKMAFSCGFIAHSAELVSKMAKVLGKDADAVHYAAVADRIKADFVKRYVQQDGRIAGDTQGGYVIALHFDLLPNEMRPAAADNLLRKVREAKYHPTTGIQLSHRLMLELSRYGHHDVAAAIMDQHAAPSWGYQIDCGATTVWEQWAGFAKGHGQTFNDQFVGGGMNSFNHYALGSVGEWVWKDVVGIQPDDEHPAYEHVAVHPQPSGNITWAHGRYDSIRGAIDVNWKLDGERFSLQLTVPPNTRATVILPTRDPASIQQVLPVKDGNTNRVPPTATIEVDSGTYAWTAKYVKP